AGSARMFHAIVHRFRPVLSMSDGQERFTVEKAQTVSVRVYVGRVSHVVTGPFKPTDEIVLPVEELAAAIPAVRPVPRYLHCAGRTGDSVCAVTVVLVKALAGRAIVRVI